MAPVYMNNDWYWGITLLNHYSTRTYSIHKTTDEDRTIVSNLIPRISNAVYNIYVVKEKVIIKFM